MLVCIATSSFAQVKVDSIGRVTNGDTLNVSYSSTPTPRGQGSLGEQTTILAYGDYNHGMAIYAKTSASWGPALLVSSKYYYDRQVAIMASASNAQPQSSGRSYGIIASAGNRTSGHNCGVVGNLIGTNYGAAVVGCFDWDIPVIIGCDEVNIGSNVVDYEPTGNVIITDTGNLKISNSGVVNIPNGFEIKKGGQLLIENNE